MEAYIQTFIGVLVSIILFMAGYRQTVGAKKERVRAAITDIEKTLLRRIVLDAYKPTINEIVRLTEGKARDYKVRVSDLLTPSQVLGMLFTRVVETDFVTPDQREKILERINPILLSIEQKPPEVELVQAESSVKRSTFRQWMLSLMAVTTSIIGTLVSISLYRPANLDINYAQVIILVFGVSVAFISTFILLQRIKEKQEEPLSISPNDYGLQFEREVVKIINSLGIGISAPIGQRNRGFDFMVKVGNRKIIIEVKAWSRRPPLVFIRQTLNRLQLALKNTGANEAILVMKEDFGFLDNIKENNVRIVPLKSLRDYLVSMKS